MPKIRLLLVGDHDELYIADEVTARNLSIAQGEEITLDDLAAIHGTLVEIPMRTPTWEQEQSIRAQGVLADDVKGFAENATAISLATVGACIVRWPKEMAPFVPEGVRGLLDNEDPGVVTAVFKKLNTALAQNILALINRKTYPSLAEHPDFSRLWSGKPPSSGAETK